MIAKIFLTLSLIAFVLGGEPKTITRKNVDTMKGEGRGILHDIEESGRVRQCVEERLVGHAYGDCANTRFKEMLVNTCEYAVTVIGHNISLSSVTYDVITLLGADGVSESNLYVVDKVYSNCAGDVTVDHVYESPPLTDAYHCAKMIYPTYDYAGQNGGCYCSSTKNTCGNIQTTILNTCSHDILVQVVTSLTVSDYYTATWNLISAYDPSSPTVTNALVVNDVSYCSTMSTPAPFVGGVVYA